MACRRGGDCACGVIDMDCQPCECTGAKVIGMNHAPGAVELVERAVTGNTFHRYLCPQRTVPADAVAVHGLMTEFLADKPLFGDGADEFLAFVGDAPLVAHNAGFAIALLNAELKRAAKPVIATERVVDTLVLARRKQRRWTNARRPMLALWR